MSQTPLLRRLFLFDGFVLFIGRISDTNVHAHYAIQIAVAIDGPFSLGEGQAPATYGATLIPSNVPHQLRVPDGGVLLLYVDPTTLAGEALVRRYSAQRCHRLEAERFTDTRSLARKRLQSGCSSAQATELLDQLLGHVASPIAMTTVLDKRVRETLARLDRDDADDLDVAALAREVALSPSRLRHLFREQVGIPIRSYKLWSKIQRAARNLATGMSLTDTAHASGFSDSAHLSRTYRRVFGVAPSELMSHSQIERVREP